MGTPTRWQTYFLAVSAVTLLSAFPSSAAEITCYQNPPPTPAIPWAELTPSGRTPGPDACYIILIKGTINTGDSAKFAQLLSKSHPFAHRVMLWSSGGLVEEAMKVGRLIRKGLLETETASQTYIPKLAGPDERGSLYGGYRGGDYICRGTGCHCASACFLIWAAGINRSGDAIGLHRPTTTSTTFANMPLDRASVLYRQLLTDIGNYLVEMEIPRRFVEIMTDTSSNDIRWLNYDEVPLMEEVPSTAEWVALTCGAMSKAEKDTMSKIGTEIAWPKNVSQRDRMLHDTLQKRSIEIGRCAQKKIWKARDAISM
jgi:hypothetical protein